MRETRLDYAPTFVSEKDFNSRQETTLKEDVNNPESEAGQAFRQYLLDNDILPSNPAEVASAQKKFIADTKKAQDPGAQRGMFMLELDKHIGTMRDLEAALVPPAPTQTEMNFDDPNGTATAVTPEETPAVKPVKTKKNGQTEMDLTQPVQPEAVTEPVAPDPAQMATEIIRNAGVPVNDQITVDVARRMEQIKQLPTEQRATAARALVANYTSPAPKVKARKPDTPATDAAPVDANVLPVEAETVAAVKEEKPLKKSDPNYPWTPNTPTRGVEQAISKAEALLGKDWVEQDAYQDLANIVNGTTFNARAFTKGMAEALNPTPAPDPTAEVAADPKEQVDGKQEITKMRQKAIAFANKTLGDEWFSTNPELMEDLNGSKFGSFDKKVKALAPKTDVAVAENTEVAVPETEVAVTDSVISSDAIKRAKLSGNETKVFGVLSDAISDNDEDAIIQADGKWNTAEIGKRAGVGPKAANTYIKRIVEKLAKSIGATPEQMKEVLRQKGIENRTVEEAAGINDPVSVQDIGDVNDSMETLASANQGARDGMTKEDEAYLDDNISKEPDAYESKRLELADKGRLTAYKQAVEKNGRKAITMWAALSKESGANVDMKSLTAADLRDWVMSVSEYESSKRTEADEAALIRDQRAIEKKYANGGITQESIDNEVSQTSEVRAISSPTTTKKDGGGSKTVKGRGNKAKPDGGTSAGASRAGSKTKTDTGVVGEAKPAPVVEVKSKTRKKSPPAAKSEAKPKTKPKTKAEAEAKPPGLMPESFETGQEFVADVLHGTTEDVDEFSPDRMGDNTNAASARQAFFFAAKPSTANSYANTSSPMQQKANFKRFYTAALKLIGGTKLNAAEQADVDAMRARAKELKAMVVWDAIVDAGKGNLSAARSMVIRFVPSLNPQVQMRRIRMKNPLVHDYKGSTKRDITYDALITKAKKAGHDGVVMLNTYDRAGKLKSELTKADQDTIFAVFDAENITTTFKKRTDTTKFSRKELKDFQIKFGKSDNPTTLGELEAAYDTVRPPNEPSAPIGHQHGFVKLFSTAKDAAKATRGQFTADKLYGVQGFVFEGRAFLIAENIDKGDEQAVIAHELGVHIAMSDKFSTEEMAKLSNTVREWGNSPEGSVERQIHDNVATRLAVARAAGMDSSLTNEETVAYAAEEALRLGVEPTKFESDPDGTVDARSWFAKLHDMLTKVLEFGQVLSPEDFAGVVRGFASAHTQYSHVETGAITDDRQVIADYYAGKNRKVQQQHPDAHTQPLDPNGVARVPGEEVFQWGVDSTFGELRNIITAGFDSTESGSRRYFSVALFYVKPDGTVGQKPQVELEFTANGPLIYNEWDLSVYGPDGGLITTKTSDGDVMPKLPGVKRAETRRLLIESRRRLTRNQNGRVPNVNGVRVTGIAANSGKKKTGVDGRPIRYDDNTIKDKFSRRAPKFAVSDAPSWEALVNDYRRLYPTTDFSGIYTIEGLKDAAIRGETARLDRELEIRRNLDREVRNFIGAEANWRVQTVRAPEDLIGLRMTGDLDITQGQLAEVLNAGNPQGVVFPNAEMVTQAFFFSDNILPGQERAVMLHEIGGHIGMDGVLSKQQKDVAVNKIKDWAKADDGSLESNIAKRVEARIDNAVDNADQIAEQLGEKSSFDEQSEYIAYFLEEAINAGVDFNSAADTSLVKFVRQLWANFKKALRKLRPENAPSLTAQHLVNMAQGAARLDLVAPYHGTGGNFRRFNHNRIGAGEGVNVYGVGTYLGQFMGTVKYYMNQEINNKGLSKANLVHVDHTLELDEMLNWEKMMRDQPTIQAAFNRLPKFWKDAVVVETRKLYEDLGLLVPGESLNDITFDYVNHTATGERMYDMMLAAVKKEYGAADAYSRNGKEYNWKRIGADYAVTDILSDAGIRGVRFEDAATRHGGGYKGEPTYNFVIFDDKDLIVVGKTSSDNIKDNSLAVDPGTTRFSVAPKPQRPGKIGRGWQKKTADYIRETAGDETAEYSTTLMRLLSMPARGTKNLERKIRDVEHDMPSAREWMKRMLESVETRNENLSKVGSVVEQARALNRERREVVNDFLSTSTFYQKWGYDPEWIGKDGKEIEVKVDPIMQRKFDRLSVEEQALVKDVFEHGRTMQKDLQKRTEELGVSKFFKFDSILTGPYAPLKRYGDFVAELKSQALLDAEAARNAEPNKRTNALVEKLKSDDQHYVVSFFDSMGAADNFAEKNKSKYAYSESSEKRLGLDEARTGGAQIYEKLMGALNANIPGLDENSKVAMEKMVKDMYFQTLDESNARLSGVKRLNIAGFDKDMLRSFAKHGQAQANLITQMTHGGEIAGALVEAGLEASKSPKELMPTYNDLARKFRSITTPRNGFLQKLESGLVKFNSVYMLTSSIGYFIQNSVQSMYGMTMISGDMGFGKTSSTLKAMNDGYRVASKVINTSVARQLRNVATLGLWGKDSTVKLNIDEAPPEMRDMLKTLQKRGLLDVGIVDDVTFDGSDGTGNTLTEAYREMTHRLYQSARHVEAMNRISTAVAAFKMAQKNPKVMKRMGLSPMEYAIRVVQDTQGNFTSLDSPALFDIPGTKIPLQFRKYQAQMAWMHIDAFQQAFGDADPAMKAAGFRKLSLMMAATSIVGGLAALPGASVISWVIQMAMSELAGEDDEMEPNKDTERWIRDNVDDEGLATLLSRGVPAFLGFDMSQKTTLNDLFMPWDNRFVRFDSEEGGALAMAAQILFGPTGTTFNNITNIVDFLDRGDFARAAEYAMPRGLRSYMETLRYANEGYQTRSELTVSKADNFNLWDLMTNATGMPSTKVNKLKWTIGQQYEIKEHFTSESTRIRREYLQANRERDRAKQKQLRLEFRKLQDAKDKVRPFFNNSYQVLKRQSVADLIRVQRDRGREQRRLDSQMGLN